jgi:hypothetical protein
LPAGDVFVWGWPLLLPSPVVMRSEVLADRCFPFYANLRMREAMRATSHPHPLQRLEQLKQAIWAAHDDISRGRREHPALQAPHRDSVATAMSYLRFRQQHGGCPGTGGDVPAADYGPPTSPPHGHPHTLPIGSGPHPCANTGPRAGSHRHEGLQEAAAAQDATTQQKQNNAKRLFARLRIQTGSTLTAVRAADGQTRTDPAGMAAALADHWRGVFTRRPTHTDAVELWLAEAHRLQPPRPADWADTRHWSLRREDSATALQRAGDSAAGPDGIPYSALRRAGPVMLEAMYEVAKHLETHGAADLDRHSPSFNHGLLCCLPKAATMTTDTGEDLYAPGDTRPLAIVHCTNRTIANAFRLRWEPNFEPM